MVDHNLDEPAVDLGRGESLEDPPEGQASPVESSGVPHSEADYKRVAAGVFRSVDRCVSAVLRIPTCADSELRDYAEMLTPAVKEQGGKIGPKIWLVVGLLSIVGFVLGKIATAYGVRQAQAVAEQPANPDVSGWQRKPVYPNSNGNGE